MAASCIVPNLIDAFSEGLESVHVDDGRGDGHDDAEDGRTEAAAAANLDLKSERKFISIRQMVLLVLRTLRQLV